MAKRCRRKVKHQLSQALTKSIQFINITQFNQTQEKEIKKIPQQGSLTQKAKLMNEERLEVLHKSAQMKETSTTDMDYYL